MKIIDTHQHVFWHGKDDSGLIADMDENGVTLAWLLTWEIPAWEDRPSVHGVLNPEHIRPDGTHAGIPLSDLIRARDRHPSRFVLGYCPHPLIGDPVVLLEAAHKIHGVRVCGEWKFQIPLDDPRCIRLFRKAGELCMPVVLHLDVPFLADMEGGMSYQPLWYGGTLENLERALIACPGTVFIGHAPGFWREISGDAAMDPAIYPSGPICKGGRLEAMLKKYPNLMADLSAGSGLGALQRDSVFARELLEAHSDRFLFGRDTYGNQLLEFLNQLDLSPAVAEKIFHKNAQLLLPA